MLPANILLTSQDRAELSKIVFSRRVNPGPKSILILKSLETAECVSIWHTMSTWIFSRVICLFAATAAIVRTIQLPRAPTINTVGHE
jgi:hypothetical protein